MMNLEVCHTILNLLSFCHLFNFSRIMTSHRRDAVMKSAKYNVIHLLSDYNESLRIRVKSQNKTSEYPLIFNLYQWKVSTGVEHAEKSSS